jgi:hypothetical protein
MKLATPSLSRSSGAEEARQLNKRPRLPDCGSGLAPNCRAVAVVAAVVLLVTACGGGSKAAVKSSASAASGTDASTSSIPTASSAVTTTTLSLTASVQQAVARPVFSTELNIAFTDGEGYTFEGSLALAIDQGRKDIANSPPGQAHLTAAVAVSSRIRNTTPGRNATINDPGTVSVVTMDTGLIPCYTNTVFVTNPDDVRCEHTAGSAGGNLDVFTPVTLKSGDVYAGNPSLRQLDVQDTDARIDKLLNFLSGGTGIVGYVVKFETSGGRTYLALGADGALLKSCPPSRLDSLTMACEFTGH